jgi:hypothetical protein
MRDRPDTPMSLSFHQYHLAATLTSDHRLFIFFMGILKNGFFTMFSLFTLLQILANIS